MKDKNKMEFKLSLENYQIIQSFMKSKQKVVINKVFGQ